jgi:hypothetical protein
MFGFFFSATRHCQTLSLLCFVVWVEQQELSCSGIVAEKISSSDF